MNNSNKKFVEWNNNELKISAKFDEYEYYNKIENYYKSARIVCAKSDDVNTLLNTTYHDWLSLDDNECLIVNFYGKLPEGLNAQGKILNNEPIWPAFWMMGSEITNPEIGWSACSEIDVMEWSLANASINGSRTKYTSAIHYNTNEYGVPFNNDNKYLSALHDISNALKYNESLTNSINKYSVKIYRYTDRLKNKIEFLFNNTIVDTIWNDDAKNSSDPTGNTAIFGDNIINHEEYWYPYKRENGVYVIDYESEKRYMLLMNIAVGGFFTSLNPLARFDECTMIVQSVEVIKKKIS